MGPTSSPRVEDKRAYMGAAAPAARRSPSQWASHLLFTIKRSIVAHTARKATAIAASSPPLPVLPSACISCDISCDISAHDADKRQFNGRAGQRPAPAATPASRPASRLPPPASSEPDSESELGVNLNLEWLTADEATAHCVVRRRTAWFAEGPPRAAAVTASCIVSGHTGTALPLPVKEIIKKKKMMGAGEFVLQ